MRRLQQAVTALAAVLFAVSAQNVASQETVLYAFGTNGSDASRPYAGLIFDDAGSLYGTTVRGGAHSDGAVFELSPKKGGGWTESVIYSFGSVSGDGQNPYGPLIFDGQGNLYGTTSNGGTYLAGTVFELSPAEGGSWTETVLYSFKNFASDGNYPRAGLVFDGDGNLYGTTMEGGTASSGTVFELSPKSGSAWTEAILHNFTSIGGDGTFPYAGLIFDQNGNLYGTTLFGGSPYGPGTVFRLTPGAGGTWTETVLHSFRAESATDGTNPQAGLIMDADGNLYGTTQYGGKYGSVYADGGTVFELSPGSGDTWTLKVLYSFGASASDGENPFSGVIFDDAGNLYGTTQIGGDFAPDGTGSGGTVFALSPQKDGSWNERILHSFGGTVNDGNIPYSGSLVLDSAGNLYGTTSAGGSSNTDGTVFEIAPTPTAVPVFTPGAGSYAPVLTVTITDSTPGAVIYYTTNGDVPTTSSTRYTAPIKLSASETLRAIAVAPGYAVSGVATAKYVIAPPAVAPVILLKAGAYAAPQTVKITDATVKATIYYTVNGATPTIKSTKYTAAISVKTDETIKAVAIAPGFSASKVVSAAYTIKTATPVFSVKAGIYTKAQLVKITCATAGAAIYYTTNGATPTTAAKKYTGAIAVSATQTIKAIALAKLHTVSVAASAAYTIEKPTATPVITPKTGTYKTTQTVKITDAMAKAVIYYTVNGTTPTAKSLKYTKTFAVSKTTTVKAIAIAPGSTTSAVATSKLTF